jgi:hypothetical protein
MKTKERIKSNGEIFTPIALVNEILDELPEEVWESGKTFCDPSAGNGNFLVEVLRRKIQNEDKTSSLRELYGVELMQDNVDILRDRLLEIAGDTPVHRDIVNRNIVCADALTFDWNAFGEEPLYEL